jgi:hypothetical protein
MMTKYENVKLAMKSGHFNLSEAYIVMNKSSDASQLFTVFYMLYNNYPEQSRWRHGLNNVS